MDVLIQRGGSVQSTNRPIQEFSDEELLEQYRSLSKDGAASDNDLDAVMGEIADRGLTLPNETGANGEAGPMGEGNVAVTPPIPPA